MREIDSFFGVLRKIIVIIFIDFLLFTDHLLFEGEDVVIEELVQFFVCVIDAKLLEAVHLNAKRNFDFFNQNVISMYVCTYSEIFESKYVQHANKSTLFSTRIRAGIDLAHEPRKRARIQRFGHGMSIFPSLRKKE